MRLARYADDFLVLVKSLPADQQVMQSLSRFTEGRLRLVVNRQKIRAAPLSACAHVGFPIRRGRIVWTDKASKRFRERIQETTSATRGARSGAWSRLSGTVQCTWVPCQPTCHQASLESK